MYEGSVFPQWLHDKVKGPATDCNACGQTLVEHMYGAPLMVCSACFPGEEA